MLSILIGAGVAISGVILQGITRNDLASPDTVGVNAGSGLGMMFLLVMYPTAATQLPWLLPRGGRRGAMATTALVFALAYRQGTVLPSRLLLVGIAVGFGAQAAMLLLSLRMSFTMYNYVLTWMSGTLAAGDWASILLLLPCSLVLVPLAVSRARVLDVLVAGRLAGGGPGRFRRSPAAPAARRGHDADRRVRGHRRPHRFPRPGGAASRPAAGRTATTACCFPPRHSAARHCC